MFPQRGSRASTRGDDPIAARAGEREDVAGRHVDIARQRARSSARARNRRVLTVEDGMSRHCAVSSTLMSSISRMTNTVR